MIMFGAHNKFPLSCMFYILCMIDAGKQLKFSASSRASVELLGRKKPNLIIHGHQLVAS